MPDTPSSPLVTQEPPVAETVLETPTGDVTSPADTAVSDTGETAEAIRSTMDEAATHAIETVSSIGAAPPPKLETLHSLAEFSVSTVYLIGTSFILGSLFTIFVLVLLDFMRRHSNDSDKS